MIGKQGVSLLKGHQGVQDKETLSDANEIVNRGIYDATTLSAVDADLVAANIASGVTLFGIAGTLAMASALIQSMTGSGDITFSPAVDALAQVMTGSGDMTFSPAVDTPTKAWS